MKKKQSNGWGGRRPGAGRPKGTGTGPSGDARTERVVAMLSKKELKVMKRVARTAKIPVGTMAHRIIARSLAHSA